MTDFETYLEPIDGGGFIQLGDFRLVLGKGSFNCWYLTVLENSKPVMLKTDPRFSDTPIQTSFSGELVPIQEIPCTETGMFCLLRENTQAVFERVRKVYVTQDVPVDELPLSVIKEAQGLDEWNSHKNWQHGPTPNPSILDKPALGSAAKFLAKKSLSQKLIDHHGNVLSDATYSYIKAKCLNKLYPALTKPEKPQCVCGAHHDSYKKPKGSKNP